MPTEDMLSLALAELSRHSPGETIERWRQQRSNARRECGLLTTHSQVIYAKDELPHCERCGAVWINGTWEVTVDE